MSIEFICSNQDCRRKLEVGDELAGKKVRCPRCKVISVAPEPAPDRPQSGMEALDSTLHRTRRLELPYDAERELAHGGMGAVLVARDKAIQRELAVKVMRPQIADSEEHRLRFLEEAQVTGQLEHPNIVPIHELGKDADGNLYFTMKLVKGKSLGELLKELKSVGVRENGSMGEKRPDKTARAQTPTPPHSHTPTLPDLLGVFLKVCDGIAFAHSKGVIHRDLKPDNIMVGEFGEVQIMDWGLAKVVGDKAQEEGAGVSVQVSGEEEADPSGLKPETRNLESESAVRRADTVRSVRSGTDIALTVDGQITGTPAYMPPEQAEGKLELIDHRSDVYSLGAILYEILTLERPIEGDTVHKVLLNVSDGNITPPEQRTPGRHIPKELSAVVMKAMAKNRRRRYQSVQDLSQDIKLFLEGRSVSAKTDSLTETVVKLVKRNRGASIATGVAAAILLVGVVVGFVKIAAERNEAIRQKKVAEGALEQARKADEAKAEMSLKASRRSAEQAARAAGEGRFDEAEIRAEAARELAPWGPWGDYAKGALAWERRELQKAEEHLKAARERDKEEPTIRNLLVRVQAAAGKAKEAASLLENLDKIEKWEDLLAAGDVLYGVEDYRRAQTLYDAAVGKMKADPAVTPERLLAAEDKLGNARAWVKCEGFYESIKDLPAKEQYVRIAAKLEEIHGKGVVIGPVIVDGALREVDLDGHVRYLQPLKGVPLQKLWCNRSGVSDLGPLKGMPLQNLNCETSRVTDLSPLRGMPLTLLGCGQSRVGDLGPLKGMPLQALACYGTRVTDLEPLRGMPLTRLYCASTKVSDLTPLTGMLLTELWCYNTQVSDLSPLRGMPLTLLRCSESGVSDLSPLKGMPLTTLDCSNTGVSDLSPLKGMPLKTLSCPGTQVSDLSPLRGMPLTTLTCPGTQVSDLSPLRGMPLTTLTCTGTQVGDLSPLKGMPLTTLYCHYTQVGDLSPLKGMPLTTLHCSNTQVNDLSPLRGSPLNDLYVYSTRVSDLTPLEGMNLKRLAFTPKSIVKGIEIIREMRNISRIGVNGPYFMPPAEFWKKYDAGEFR